MDARIAHDPAAGDPAGRRATGGWHLRWPGRARSRWLIAGCALILLAVLVRICLPWILVWTMNRELQREGAYRGHVDGVSLALWRGAYGVDGLRVTVQRGDGEPQPVLSVRRIDISLSWSELLHGRIRSSVVLLHPDLIIAPVGGGALPPLPADPGKPPAGNPEERWQDRVGSVIAFRIDELRIDGGGIRYVDEARGIDLRITEFDASIHGITGGRGERQIPATFNLRGRTTGNGDLRVEGSVRPWSEDPDFDIRASLEGLSLAALNPSAKRFKGLVFRSGSLTAFSELHASRGELSGYVKPLFTDLDIASYGDDADNAAKKIFTKALIALGEAILPNDDTDALAARVPVHGRFDHPSSDVWPVIGSVIGNAFLSAILPGFEGMERFTVP